MVKALRRRDGAARRKATFVVAEDLLEAVDAAVAAGAAQSKNVFVEKALAHAIGAIRRAERRARLDAARRDPLFLRDPDEVEPDFRFAGAETARAIV